MSHSIRLVLIAVIPSLTVATAPALAAGASRTDHASRQETVGVTTGFALGAVAGGPIGAILGGAAGGWLGDRYHRQHLTNTSLSADLERTTQERDQLAGHVQQLRQGLDAVDAIGMDVSFRTDDASMSTDSVPPLLKLAALTATLPEGVLQVDGYADPRGAPEANQALSARRAQAVAQVLRQAGLAPERIVVKAHGAEASASEPGDLDGYAFDRRVTVRLERGAQARAAGRPGTEDAVAAR